MSITEIKSVLTDTLFVLDRYVEAFMSRVKKLLKFGVILLLVFDGERHPTKATTHEDRDR